MRWDTIYIDNFDGFSALKTGVATLEDVRQEYDWEPESRSGLPPNPNKGMDVVVRLTARHSVDVSGHEIGGPPKRVAPIVDCDGLLLYVIELISPDTSQSPGGINIYDKHGSLVAYAIASSMVARYQFVDMNGYLLATAEAPGLHENVSFADLPKEPAKGYMLPYGVHFEPGNYADASRLLGSNYRWVIAAATQMRAIHDAHGPRGGGFSSPQSRAQSAAHTVAVTIYWILAALGLLITLFVMYSSYACVYPSRVGRKALRT